MHLSNGREVVLVGGSSELVIYEWDLSSPELKLIEFCREPYTNVIEIAVRDNWFTIKYKKNKAKLFRIIVDANEFDIQETFDLKMKPFKSPYKTMEIFRLRKQQLMIVDSSYESDGKELQMEIFSVKEKRTLDVETLKLQGKSMVTAISYTPEYRKMLVFDEEKNMEVFEFKKDPLKSTKSEIKQIEFKKVDCEGYVSRIIMNKTNKIYIYATSKGEIVFIEADTLKLNTQITGNQYIIHLMVCEQIRDTCLYIIEKDSKDMAKFVLEPVLGNLIMERYEDKNPIYYRGDTYDFIFYVKRNQFMHFDYQTVIN